MALAFSIVTCLSTSMELLYGRAGRLTAQHGGFRLGQIDKLKLPPDVAGATFMAAGSSAPELFVATAAIFTSGDFGHQCVMEDGKTLILSSVDSDAGFDEMLDFSWQGSSEVMQACADKMATGSSIHIDEGVGVGAVVGSTMFNTLCIIGGAARVTPDCHFRKTGAEYDKKPGKKWLSCTAK